MRAEVASGSRATPLEADAEAAMHALLGDARLILDGGRSGVSAATLEAAFTEAFSTRESGAWVALFDMLRTLERRAAQDSGSARRRVQAFLAENADLGEPESDLS